MRNINIFALARQKVNLAGFVAQTTGKQGRTIGRSLRFTTCPGCGEGASANPQFAVNGEFFSCHRCGVHGDVSMFAALAWGVESKEAATRLISDAFLPIIKQDAGEHLDAVADPAAVLSVLSKIRDAIQPPPQAVVGYFAGRGISDGVLKEASQRGLMSFLPTDPNAALAWVKKTVGEDLLRESGIWRQGARAPAMIYRPIVSLTATSLELRLARSVKATEPKSIQYGKPSPWVWEGREGGHCAIVEGIVDLLSMIEMGYAGTVYAIPGCSSWKPDWFPVSKKTHIIMDGDDAGKIAADRIYSALYQKGVVCAIKDMPIGHDANSILMQRKSL